MKLINFLLPKMLLHGDKIAFVNSHITYRELVNLILEQSKKYKETEKLIYTQKNEKEKQAIEILSILASKNVCVPVTTNYGIKQKNYIIDLIKEDRNNYPDLAFIMFTSGTSSTSKGVMLTDDNIVSNILAIDHCFKINPSESILIIRPLVHISALVGELLYGLFKGLTIHFYEDVLMPQKINKYIHENQISILGSTPTMFNLFLKTKCNLKGLKYGIISGEVLGKDLAMALFTNYKQIEFFNVYGMTENSPRATALSSDDFFKYPGSVGKPLLNTKIQIIDHEIVIRSPSIMKGYYKNQELTNERMINGWFFTRDNGYFNKEGYLYVLGRRDNAIIKSGLNIYPEEIENIVKKYEGVKECLVYKVKDQNHFDSIGLKVIGNVSKNELYQYLCKELPAVLVPSYIKITNKLNKTESGKIKR